MEKTTKKLSRAPLEKFLNHLKKRGQILRIISSKGALVKLLKDFNLTKMTSMTSKNFQMNAMKR